MNEQALNVRQKSSAETALLWQFNVTCQYHVPSDTTFYSHEVPKAGFGRIVPTRLDGLGPSHADVENFVVTRRQVGVKASCRIPVAMVRRQGNPVNVRDLLQFCTHQRLPQVVQDRCADELTGLSSHQ